MFKKFRFIFLLFTFCIISINLTSCSGTEDKKFEELSNSIFTDELRSNTLNLHYTLTNPEKYDIGDCGITFGDFSSESRNDNLEGLSQLQKQVSKIHTFFLSDKRKLDHAVLTDYLDTQLALSKYQLFHEILTPSNGLQSQLPILLAEYKFRSKDDVEDYLKLLSTIDTYYSQMIDFEKEKAKAGLFMSDSLCLTVIKECETFIKNPNDNYLLDTFDHRINELQSLSKKEKKAYIEKNRQIISDHVIPAYNTLILGLTSLLGTGRNDFGLCNYKNGRDYYELLVRSETGSSDTIAKLDQRICNQRDKDLSVCRDIQKRNSCIEEDCASLEWTMESEEEMIETLQEALTADFPEISDTNCQISYVDACMEEALAPAFYITAPYDDYKDNTIYINNANQYSGIYYFTTLAHEGYPGHLYQTVMSYDYGISPLRSLLDYGGYIEGWATYVEMMSYYYAGLDKDIASFLQHNQAATLSLYASSDIGIHYYGWTLKDMHDFWKKYGVTDIETIERIMDLILSDPGNYLKYYVGYLEFEHLKSIEEKNYKADFSLKKFHKALLQIGPAPFDIIKQYFPDYYDKT